MKILVFGGNRFFGRKLVELLAEAGHDITVVNRGNLPNFQHERVQFVRGDRNDDDLLKRLAQQCFWDALFDQCCYSSVQAQKMSVFRGRVGRYLLTSTIGVYQAMETLTETSFDPGSYRGVPEKNETYEEGKRKAESAISQSFENSVLVRFPIVLGPDDPTKRLAWHFRSLRWQMPIFCNTFDSEFPVIHRDDAALALKTLLESSITGPVHLSCKTTLNLRVFYSMIEKQTGLKYQFVDRISEGASSPFAFRFSQRLDLSKWREHHQEPRDHSEWLMNLISDEDQRIQKELAEMPLRTAPILEKKSQSIHFNTNATLVEEPFRHILIDQFLPKNSYEALCDQMAEMLSTTQSSRQFDDRFTKAGTSDPNTKKSYQALISRWLPNISSPASIFYSRDFFDFMQSFFQVPFAPEILGSFHHHFLENPSGWVHSDYNLVRFPIRMNKEGLNPVSVLSAEERKRQIPQQHSVCRSVAILYYFHNPEWKSGDGGETGLWRNSNGPPEKMYAPVNNRLIAFQISPRSFHSFIKNTGGPRNCIAYWFHSDPRWMETRYGAPPRSSQY